MDIFKITKEGVELVDDLGSKPSHDLFVQYTDYIELEQKMKMVIEWCQTNIEDQTLVSGFALQVRNTLER